MKKISQSVLFMMAVASTNVVAKIQMPAPVVNSASQTLKIGVADMERVYKSFYKTSRMEEEFGNLVKNAERELQSLLKEGDGLVKRYQELQSKLQNPALSEKAKNDFVQDMEKLQKTLQLKEKEVAQFRQETGDRLERRRQAMIDEQIKEIQPKCDMIAQKHNLDLLLNSNGPNVIYSKQALDYTEEIIRAINATAPKADAKK